MGWKLGLGGGVVEVVAHVGEEGAAGLELFDEADGFFEVGVAEVGSRRRASRMRTSRSCRSGMLSSGMSLMSVR